MVWYHKEAYVNEYQEVFSVIGNINDKIKMIEYYRDRLYCNNPNKWRYYAIIINAIANDETIQQLYGFNENAYHWSGRVYRKINQIKPGSIVFRPKEVYNTSLPVCYDTSDQEFGGLYFIGATYFVPTTMMPIYAVKIGQSYWNIGRRIRDYGTANPFIYHEKEHVLPDFICPDANEKTCHEFLASVAIQKLEKNTEWFIVDEKTYFQLCELFKDKVFFGNVATGKIRAI